MENLNEYSELELATRAIFEQHDKQVVTFAQRAVFLPHLWEEGIAGNESVLEQFEPELSEAKEKIQALKDNGGTLIGMTRTWYYFSHEQQEIPLPFPEGETYESLESTESLTTANFVEALNLLRGLPDAEKEKLLMMASKGTEACVWFSPKKKDQLPKAKLIAGVKSYMGVKFENGNCPVFSQMLQTCIDIIHESIAANPKLLETEMIILTNQN